MTSKHLFFKMMKEDLRHRVWMIVMSVLASCLLLPVIWLIFKENLFLRYNGDPFFELDMFVVVKDFLESVILVVGGIIGICGALIAALAGFRFVLHRDQVDTWHSLPVKRDMLFGVCYLNGMLIWLLPLFVGVVLVGVLSGSLLTGGGDLNFFADVLKLALRIFAVWVVVFLLIYDLALTAMMFSGNVLNTIVSMLILGFGAVSCCGLYFVLLEFYFDTYVSRSYTAWTGAIYASPLVSVWGLLLDKREMLGNFPLWIYGLEAVALGSCAWILYRRRPSELSEQGIRCKVFATALRLVTTIAAGVVGWLLFHAMVNGEVVWAVFGSLLAVVLVHGILNVVFQMEFRAFFAHKAQLVGVTAAVLLVCFCFVGDWFGYDSYCPKKEEIAEIGLRVESLANPSNGRMGDPLKEMQYRDREAAYAFLWEMSQKAGRQTGPSETIWVRVTLENGRTYYRRYYVSEAERDVLMPLIDSREYLETLYCLDDRMAEDGETMSLQMQQGTIYYGDNIFTKEEMLPLFQAYNQDVLDDPETVLLGKGRVLAGVEIAYGNKYAYRVFIGLEIYETMSRTIQVLKEMGYEKQMSFKTAAEITSIKLEINNLTGTDSAEEIIEAARERYGVFGTEPEETVQAENQEKAAAAEVFDTEGTVAAEQKAAVEIHGIMLSVTDPEEVEELLSLISYKRDDRVVGFLKKRMIDVKMTDKDGTQSTGYIRKGDLPEKYILRFGELAEK